MARSSRRIGLWAFVVVAVLGIALGVFGTFSVQRLFKPTVRLDTTTVSEQLERVQELATAKLSYRGLVKYEEGDIDFINKKGFTMIYDAEVRAGVDLSKARVDVDGRTVRVALPAAAVQSISIDPDSIQFYDEKFALFNWQNRMDAAEALKLAQENANAKVDASKLIAEANDQAVEATKALLAPFAGERGYTVTVEIDSSDATAPETAGSATGSAAASGSATGSSES
ncbi:MAG: DUF4230 domain-containing protein [Coriobacteriaceae bacterium]|nr:DUF4230 domain-containing protein [Coriobacteriaceae bacterium]